MALVAGYVSHLQYSEAEILERLRRFSIVPGDAPDSYEHHVVATSYGALMVKHKRGYPIPPTLVLTIVATPWQPSVLSCRATTSSLPTVSSLPASIVEVGH
jgi:hypothetical protein